jgi:hypothetical protein
MKRVLIICLVLSVALNVFSQIELIVYPKTGEPFFADYQSKTADSLTLKQYRKVMNICIKDIYKVQTLGVHFIQDAYDNKLSNNAKVLEFDKVGKHEGWSIFLSTRLNDTNLILLFKFKRDAGGSEIDTHIITSDKDTITLKLADGNDFNFKLTNNYVLPGYYLYNFGYIILSKIEIDHLLNSPVKEVIYRGFDYRLEDEYVFMRQLFAIYDENFQWRY